jgi:hypothetical protein
VQDIELDRIAGRTTTDLQVVDDQVRTDAVDGSLEGILAATQRSTETALKAAAGVARDLRKASSRARTGQLRDLRKALASARSSVQELAEQVERVDAQFDLDEAEYLASGAFTKELLAAAESRGVAVIEEEDRLLCYPSLLRILPGEAAVEIDKVRERRLRPSVLADLLATTQQEAPRFKTEKFLDSLRAGYELLVASEQKKADAVVRLVDVWSVLTMLPGQRGHYSKQEFARDLYLLDQSGLTSTSRSPRELRWAASTGTKNTGVLVTVARSGQRQYYWGVSFALGNGVVQ